VVHIVEGGDSGWRQDVQSLDSRGPWNRESMWKTLTDVSGPARPAWALPPVEYMCAGPSGLALYPGTGESRTYDGCLFLVDFYGSGSTVHAFRCVPQGAGFKVADHVEYYKGLTITDIAWGYDGRLFMSDWGGGWAPNENGVVLAVSNTTVQQDPAEAAAIAEVRNLFRAPFSIHAIPDLIALLHHRDQRVRLAAQYELAARGSASIEALTATGGDAGAAVVTRAHAIWAIGQIARRVPEVAAHLNILLDDPDDEVRTQSLRTLADLPTDTARIATRFDLLRDPSPRVRLAAAIAMAHHGGPESVGPLLSMLAENDNADLVLRHGASFALSKVADASEVARAGEQHPSAAARLGAVLALRLMGSERVRRFLDDPDPAVAIEAARAMYDLRAGLDKLAAVLDSDIPADRAIEPLLRRAVEANALLGTDACADRLGALASRSELDAKWRLLAIERLDGWDKPLKREGVWGNWTDRPALSTSAVAAVVARDIEAILIAAAGDDELLSRAFELQAHHGPRLSAVEMSGQITDPSKPELYRRVLLDQLTELDPAGAQRMAVSLAGPGAHSAGPLRWRAMEVLAETDPDQAVAVLAGAARSGPDRDRQQAVRVLGTMTSDAAGVALAPMVRDLRLGWLDREIALEVYEAARALPEESPSRKLAEAAGVQGTRPTGYATSFLVAGGDAAKGRELFLHHASSACVKCHTADGPPTPTAPTLMGVAARLSAEKLVESVVEPGAVVAAGYGQVSAMPVMTQFLSPRQVRDVVAYLKTLDGTVEAHPQPTRTHVEPVHESGDNGNRSVLWVGGFVVAAVLGAIVWGAVTRRA
jgi:quinoprotein glucose dehydrogenase